MPSPRSRKVVSSAVVANLAIAICKYVAAAFTGSPAMLSEAFHSTADLGNEALLLIGMRCSSRPPDALHPFGHGKLLYFYSLSKSSAAKIQLSSPFFWKTQRALSELF